MLTKESSEQAHLIELIAWRCIKTIDYFDHVTGQSGTFINLVQNSLGEAACLLWCHLFGKRDDDLHYSKFFSRPDVVALGKEFSPSVVLKRVLEEACLTPEQYESFWKRMNDLRDHYIAHRDLEDLNPKFPDIGVCRNMAEKMRAIIAELALKGFAADPQNVTLQLLSSRIANHPNSGIPDESRADVELGIQGFEGWWHDG